MLESKCGTETTAINLCAGARARPWFVVAAPDSQVKHISELRTQHVVWLVVWENYVLLRGKFGSRLGDISCQRVCLLDASWYFWLHAVAAL